MSGPVRGALQGAGVSGLALAVALIVGQHARTGFVGHLDTRLPFAPPPPPQGEAPHLPRSERLIIVVVDGLRWREAQSLPSARALAERGVLRPLVADVPSTRAPSWTTLVTGLPPLYSGVRSRDLPGRPLDSLPRRAARAGLKVRFAGDSDLPALLQLPRAAAPLAPGGLAWREEGMRELVWLSIGGFEEAARRGGPCSPAYRMAAREADARVRALLSSLREGRDTLVVLSPRGQLSRGGEGGHEPAARSGFLAMTGPAVRAQGTLPAAALRDVAPTLALLLGVPLPRAAGRPLLDGLGLGPPQDARAALLHDREVASAFAAGAAPRLALACAISLALFWFVASLHRSGRLVLARRDLVPASVYAGVVTGGLLAAGYRLSLSLPRGPDALCLEAAGLTLAGLALAFALSDRKRRIEQALLGTLTLGVPYGLAAAWAGLDPRWLPGPLASALVPASALLCGPFACAFGVRAALTVRHAFSRDAMPWPRGDEPGRDG